MSNPVEIAAFAGGCFWCMQPPFDPVKGVLKTVVGYTGGLSENPSYEEVCSGVSGHAEAIQVYFDPSLISYDEILDIFWHNIDPTARDRQFCDLGTQYRTLILPANAEQQAIAEKSKDRLLSSNKFKRIATEIAPLGKFYPAEEYHQDYYKKNPERYRIYKEACERETLLKQLWSS